MISRTLLAVLALAATACASAKPPVVVVPAVPVVSLDTKVGWILRLEQQRQLREARSSPAPAVATAVETPRPDLAALVRDEDPRVRWRATLAVGRIGLPEGLPLLVRALSDVDEFVRANAAFAIGLIGSRDGVAPLVGALKDASLVVRTRAITALGLIGDQASAPQVMSALTDCGAWLASVSADDEAWPKEPSVELCREALFTLVRLRHFEGIAKIALTPQGEPVSQWWPVAFALQRSADARAVPALLTLARAGGVYSPAFALRGLAAAKEARAIPIALETVARADADVRLKVTAIRALGQLAARDAIIPLTALAEARSTPITLAIEAVTALGAIGDRRAFDAMLGLLTHPEPSLRAAAIAAAAAVDEEGFLLILSSLPPDCHWSVRAALASAIATLPGDRVRGALEALAGDADDRVKAPALTALARVGAPDLTKRMFDALDAPDFALRATAARLIGERTPEAGVPSLVRAYQRGESDAAHDARLAALEALVKYPGEEVKTTLRRALSDREWPVRLRAAELLRGLGETSAEVARPAPLRVPPEFFESERLLHPPYSPHAYIETRRGVIEIELNVVDAPFTTHSFVELARAGFYNGVRVHRLVPNFVIQVGDPRGDGEGGPGFTIRDEFSPLPYVRGTVGMALGGRETGGSQFFITLSPQPHLDGRYTVFAKVVRGFEILDAIAPQDEILQIRIWDGVR